MASVAATGLTAGGEAAVAAAVAAGEAEVSRTRVEAARAAEAAARDVRPGRSCLPGPQHAF